MVSFKTFIPAVLLLWIQTETFAQNVKLSTDTLHWKENKPLAWEDFKGKPKSGKAGEAFCELQANYEKPNPLKKTKFKIAAVWDRKNSCIAVASKTPEELLYYQVLFNLYEVHARRLRKEYSETKFGLDPEAVFRQKYNAASESLREDTNAYRDETEEGADAEKVKEWNEKAKKELKALSSFHE